MHTRCLSAVFILVLTVLGVFSLELFNALTCDEEQEYCIAWPEALLPNGVKTDGRALEAPPACVDRVDQCSYFAGNGECTVNPGI
jgi:hypothetical protein